MLRNPTRPSSTATPPRFAVTVCSVGVPWLCGHHASTFAISSLAVHSAPLGESWAVMPAQLTVAVSPSEKFGPRVSATSRIPVLPSRSARILVSRIGWTAASRMSRIGRHGPTISISGHQPGMWPISVVRTSRKRWSSIMRGFQRALGPFNPSRCRSRLRKAIVSVSPPASVTAASRGANIDVDVKSSRSSRKTSAIVASPSNTRRTGPTASSRRRYQMSLSCSGVGADRFHRPCGSSAPAAVPGQSASSHSAAPSIVAGDVQAPGDETASCHPLSNRSADLSIDNASPIQFPTLRRAAAAQAASVLKFGEIRASSTFIVTS